MATGWWVADILHTLGAWALLSWAFWVIFSITLHELGHGWAAIRVGDDTPIRTGHMSMNPLVHMGPTSLIVFAVVGIAWGAMPVNPLRFRGKHADALVAAAGPAINVGLFLVCVVGVATINKYVVADQVAEAMVDRYSESAVALTENYADMSEDELVEHFDALAQDQAAARASVSPFASQAVQFFSIGALLNSVLFILNMLPVPPLDGSRILSSFSGAYRRLIEGPNAAMISLMGILFIFLVADDAIFGSAAALKNEAVALLYSLLPG